MTPCVFVRVVTGRCNSVGCSLRHRQTVVVDLHELNTQLGGELGGTVNLADFSP